MKSITVDADKPTINQGKQDVTSQTSSNEIAKVLGLP
jgi:hypothetical protein